MVVVVVVVVVLLVVGFVTVDGEETVGDRAVDGLSTAGEQDPRRRATTASSHTEFRRFMLGRK